MARVTKQQDSKHFQKALKLSCWNSNMIRDMNNDNKFSVYFNDQVEYKRFHPGIGATGAPNGGTRDTRTGADDLSWLYAVGDLRTGYNHQYGFEHNTATERFSDPLYDLSTNDVNRLGAAGNANGRNDNRLRQMDEYSQSQPYTSGKEIVNDLTDTVVDNSGIKVSDGFHSVRPDKKWTFRKWGYQSDNVERAASNGYAENNVVYHFGHHDNKDNITNRPNMRYAASNEASYAFEDLATDANTKNKANLHQWEFDFHGFKDDWRYSLRMGGCLYEAARWVYDESSFHRTGRLTYTDDTLFMDDPFNPRDNTDIFGAHQYNPVLKADSVLNLHEFDEFDQGGMFTAGANTSSTWSNAGSTVNDSGDYQFGNCNGADCTAVNVATPSSGGVFADVHWVHVFNAHIFPLQDVGYYQYDQTLGIANTNQANDSITSRDGYGYNIYENKDGNNLVLRDVWGAQSPNVSYIDTANNAPSGQGYSQALSGLNGARDTYDDKYNDWLGSACYAAASAVSGCTTSVYNFAEAFRQFGYCVTVNSGVCASGGTPATTCWGTGAPCETDYNTLEVHRAAVMVNTSGTFTGCLSDGAGGKLSGCDTTSSAITDATAGNTIYPASVDKFVAALLTAGRAVGVAQKTYDQTISSHNFHSQYGTLNIGNIQGQYTTADRPTANATDFVPILTKTRRKIEDFNVVMANPTYEGHGFLNFVATYHDHTENHNDEGNAWIRQVGKRFLSTIGGLTTASNDQRNVCRALKDGIDSYRLNNIIPAREGDGSGANGHRGDGHDDPYLGPLGPGPAGNYGNGQRCGAAMYENFGDWFLRPAQTYSAYNKFSEMFTGTGGANADGSQGWGSGGATTTEGTTDCTALTDGDTYGDYCLSGLESYNYWAFILSENYHPISTDGDGFTDTTTTWVYQSPHELWRNGSLHYDKREASINASTGIGVPKSSGRGFAISSFPHNELGKDFRFNIRTLHNMGNGVAKQFYQIQNLKSGVGNEATLATSTMTFLTSNLRTTETVWSYYFYAVDTIKIAFPEFVARVNHCDNHLHRGDSHCLNQFSENIDNGGPDSASDTADPNGENHLSAYPGYAEGYPMHRLGFQEIIIDGVTMKQTDNQYDSRVTHASRTDSSGDGNWHKQYHNTRGLRGDDHTRATLLYADNEFANEDASLHELNAAMCGTDTASINMSTNFRFFETDSGRKDMAGRSANFQGYSDSYQPLKPCASWCALDEFTASAITDNGIDQSKQNIDGATFGDSANDRLTSHVTGTFSKYGGICGRVLRIDGLLQTYDELHNRQYGTLQEIWVQLQYAYQETMDDSDRISTRSAVNRVQSPFPNVFFSAPEVVDIRGFCPSSNMKCRGYLSDQHQPYGGSRNHVERVHWNDANVRWNADLTKAFGANQLGVAASSSSMGTGPTQTGNDWSMDRDFRGDSKWPWNYHSYSASSNTGVKYGGTSAKTQYAARDYNHDPYIVPAAAGKK